MKKWGPPHTPQTLTFLHIYVALTRARRPSTTPLSQLPAHICPQIVTFAGAAGAVYTGSVPPKRVNNTRRMPPAVTWRKPEPERDKQGRVKTAKDAQILAKMTRVPSRFASIGIKVDACEGFEPYNRQRRKWAKARFNELTEQYGQDLSRGVGARIRAAAWGYAFGEWLAAKAAYHGDAGLSEVALKLMGRASNEDEKARALAAAERAVKNSKRANTLDLVDALDVSGEST